jgi:uroporphyrinogen III methyltransferase / synthase
VPGEVKTGVVANASAPLAGKRIVVTRAVEQARELTSGLEALGATVLALPAISFVDPADFAPLDAAIANVATFDWLLFTSANAARYFAKRCRACGVDPHTLQRAARPLFVSVVGPMTAEAVAAEGFLVNHMAEEFQAAALARELADELRGKKVLLPHGDRAKNELAVALRAAGAEVTPVIAYRTTEADSAAPDVLEAVRRGETDAIAFFSGSAFRSVAAKVGLDNLRRVAIAAIGPVTAGEIRAAGLPVAVEAPKATMESFVNALVEHYSVASKG